MSLINNLYEQGWKCIYTYLKYNRIESHLIIYYMYFTQIIKYFEKLSM